MSLSKQALQVAAGDSDRGNPPAEMPPPPDDVELEQLLADITRIYDGLSGVQQLAIVATVPAGGDRDE